MSVILSPVFSDSDWIEHGFATRHASDWFDSSRLAHLKQIHSDVVAVASAPGHLGEGDALITNAPGVLVGIRTADCIPVLLADPVHLAVAAIHAGWRGTAANIVAATLRAMTREFGTKPGDVVAAIGPGIGACCYEVSGDVAAQFTEWFPEDAGREGKRHLDLIEANRRQLASAGVHAIDSLSICTKCDLNFESFRREGEAAGRMYSVIGVRR